MYHEDIKELAKHNSSFRKVLFTGRYSQLVLMSLLPNEDIGEEVHSGVDQMLFIVDGKGKGIINGEEFTFDENDTIIVPAGARHNIINTGDKDLKLYTIYAPSNHPHGLEQKTKKDAADEDY